ncbi:lytic murein transglycosylase [uncultured Enterovirga sp.]|uniref:lytic murein transglycosylase n=1 Tax=uncultured Enterovirga sp. TaxID=2026352 RepID=UPI0035CB0155
MTKHSRLALRRSFRLLVAIAAAWFAAPVFEAGPEAKPSPKAEGGASKSHGDFARFLADLWPVARDAGIARATFDAALQGLTPDPKVVALTRKQSEFSRPIWEYVNGAASGQRVAKGRAASAEWDSTFDRIERTYGVPREVVLAVWGMESGFGSNTGGLSVIRSLATLAYVRYRGDFFRDELIQALRIIQDGHATRDSLKGSWAGAMGQTQFMPSSYAAYAIDQDGDGHPNIWTSVPDALASTANYLRQKGWKPGLPWVVEVAVPGQIDLRVNRRGFADWASMGVRRTDGEGLPGSGEASLFMPTGIRGPAFLVGDNFEVIRAYNSSDAYALGVGYLANRIGGGGALARAWPISEKALSHPEKEEVQKRLAKLGLYKGEADGRHGGRTREAIREFQRRSGLVADGYADVAVLRALRDK